MSPMKLFMLCFLPSLNGRHFNCTRVCNNTERDFLTPQDNPEEEDNVQAQEKHCYGGICVAKTHHYTKYEIPHAWSVPVHGTGHGDKNVCMDKLYVMEVGTTFDVSMLRGIDEENGLIDVELNVVLTWEDPEIAVCVCDENEKSADGKYRFGRNLEEVIWKPDVHVWNFKSYERVNGLVQLNDMEVKSRDNCPTQITWGIDLQATLRCQMVMDWYPFDRNLCHVKFGSFSHPGEGLVFFNGEKTMKHSFAKVHYKDYMFKTIPLCDHETEEVVKDVNGKSSMYKVSGYSLVITRSPNRVFGEHVLVLSILVSISIFSSCLSLESGRAVLVSSTGLSAIFLMILIDETTPQGQGGDNMILIYADGCLCFILLTFIKFCILRAFLRWSAMTPKYIRLLVWVDKIFGLVWLLSFILFNLIYWQWTPGFPPTRCQNVEYNDVDCTNSDV